ncbi:NAD(P)/FAD-dependent oxidoreductase [Dactylococcopsis salina]|uniref:Sulfide-quinone reductase n=1 Tax=Dactylococcopsis salina (strain PCC 8305) TaxID=13035 RepID=K9YSL6_DACS8|nr:FAD-dependent oxidoreductase [Dactylococcopsis salina]AFZ49931.1 NADH dehydrogenase, FAD-containing subunit [Dactylococcopsis salina PCC 8305]
MAQIVIIGAGFGGLSVAYELKHLLRGKHKITLISDEPNFTFIPSLPWVAFNLRKLEQVQLSVKPLLEKQGIHWQQGRVTALDPNEKRVRVGEDITFNYDYLVIATGASLAYELIPGLGPEEGYTQSVCNPHHAEMAREAWNKFLENPGPIVVGGVPGASCMGPAYEFALLADFVLRKKGIREEVPITFISPEPYLGHLGIGGMANSGKLVTELMEQRGIKWVENAEITEIEENQVKLADGQEFPFQYAMFLPPFHGAPFLKEVPGLTDEKGFLPVLDTYQHPDYPSIYSAGVITQLDAPETTEIPLGAPKTGQMTESMAMAVAHNIARELGEIPSRPVKPSLEAICMADFGDTGIIFIAAPVVPDPSIGHRRHATALRGIWVNWAKNVFEWYFLMKMRWGTAVPWFEKLGLFLLRLSLVTPIPETSDQQKDLSRVKG